MNPPEARERSASAALSPEHARSRARLWTWIAVLGTPLGLLACYAIMLWRAQGDYLWLGTHQTIRVAAWPRPSYDLGMPVDGRVPGVFGGGTVWISPGAIEMGRNKTISTNYMPFFGGGQIRQSSRWPGLFELRDRTTIGRLVGSSAPPTLLEKFPSRALDAFLNADTYAEAVEEARLLVARFPERSTPLYWWIGCMARGGDRDAAKKELQDRMGVFLSDPSPLGAIYLEALERAVATVGEAPPACRFPYERPRWRSETPWTSLRWPEDVAQWF